MDIKAEIGLTAQSPATNAISPVLLLILDDFHRRKISYCYWKSSRRVYGALTGEHDLDLLIAREDQNRCAMILLECGLKPFPSVFHRDHPAIQSFLGYDDLAGNLVHLHLHFEIVTGSQLLKNYRLPWKDAVLARAIAHPALPIQILDPASEALLLVVRAGLELRRGDLVTLRQWAATTRKFAMDREELATRCDREALRDRTVELLGADFADMVTAAFYDGRPLEDQRRLRRRIEKRLSPYRTYSSLEAQLRSAGRTILWALGNLNKRLLQLPRPWSRRVPGGGAIVAITGVDGSGKTTVVAAMQEWLGSEIDVVPIYFGTGAGRPSLLLRPLKWAAPLFTRAFATSSKKASRGENRSRLLYRVLLTIWAVFVALEKRSKLVAARRGANRGLIVLTDRYPQNEILGFNDGPLLIRLTGIPQWLRRFEAGVYSLARRLPPDLVIKLHVAPTTAQMREPDMNPSVIRERIEAMRRVNFAAKRIVDIDAERPLAEVLSAIKHEIWCLL
jgi:thymidylate kinase